MGKHISRRGLLLGAVATVTTLNPDAAEAQSRNFKEHDFFTLIKQYEFIGRNGKIVNRDDLIKSLSGSVFSASYGFENCDKLCPYVNHGLAELGRRARAKGVKLTSVVIAVMPEVDGVSQEARDRYEKTLKEKYNLPQNVIILYPSIGGKVSKESAKTAARLSSEMGNITDMKSPVEHSMAVTLYDSTGKCIDKKIGNTTPKLFADALEKNLDAKNIIGTSGRVL